MTHADVSSMRQEFATIKIQRFKTPASRHIFYESDAMDKTQYQPKLPPMDASVAAAVALRNLDARLRACIAFGLSAAEAYDSHYQGETKAAIAAVAGQIDAAVSAERERLAARAAYEAMVK